MVYGHSRLKESRLGEKQTWDIRQYAGLEAKVLMSLRTIWQENKDQIKEALDF